MIIRRAAMADLSAVLDIERACFSVPWSESGMRAELESPDAVVNVAVEGETLLGFAVLHFFEDEGELYQIVVAEEYRGAGLGKALLSQTLRDVEEKGVRRVYLEVRKSNEAARRLYKSCGFAVCGERRGYYDAPKEDALLMDWAL